MKTQEMNGNSEGWSPTQAEVFEFLQTVPLGTIATLDSEGQPQVATVAFSQTENMEFIVGTAEDSRKAQNIAHDNRVALVATDPTQRFTVQMEGTAHKLSRDEFELYADAHFEKLPQSAPFKDTEGQCYFLIRPIHIRFSDCNPFPWVLTNFEF